MTDKEKKITGKDIGVITPYSLQARIISKLLKNTDTNIKVGSPEEFQVIKSSLMGYVDLRREQRRRSSSYQQ